jgi:hypothetical protein
MMSREKSFGLEEVFLTYQLEGSVRVNLGCHGYGKLVFKSGEEALETAATSKRRRLQRSEGTLALTITFFSFFFSSSKRLT